MSQLTAPGELMFNCSEWKSLLQLAKAGETLVFDSSNAIETRTEKGFDAAQAFLEEIEGVAESLQLQPTSRAYRRRFADHFPGMQLQEGRDYSVAVLEACMSLSRSRAIWANGYQYDLSHEAELACLALYDEWDEFFRDLDLLVPSMTADAELEPRRNDFCATLKRLDERWADFEHTYMLEIVKVQDRAKGLVYTAIGFERALCEIEEQCDSKELTENSDYQINLSSLVACIARLNIAANVKRKTSDELSVDILETAHDLLEVCMYDASSVLHAARAVAQQVVDSFKQLRAYLQEVRHHMCDLDPQLSQNAGLVTELVRWEETWIVGARYLQTRPVLGALCKLVPQIRRTQSTVPAFQQMCADFDAELFLVLPRLIWLSFFNDPGSLNEMLGNLLPHRFVYAPVPAGIHPKATRDLHSRGLRRQRSEPNLSACSSSFRPLEPQEFAVLGIGSELKVLRGKYLQAKRTLEEAFQTLSSPPAELEPPVQEVLIRRAVTGAGSAASEDPYQFLLSGVQQRPRELAEAAVEDFMLDLESWSMELQRHNAEDWNECINVLVQCISVD